MKSLYKIGFNHGINEAVAKIERYTEISIEQRIKIIKILVALRKQLEDKT